MGLISDFKAYRKKQKVESLLKEFGILELVDENKALIERVSCLEKEVEELKKNQSKPTITLTKEEEKEIKSKYESASTPQDVVSMFAEENVEYLPNEYGTKQHTKENASV